MNKKIYKGYELAEAVDNGILNLEQKVKTANNMEYYNCTIDFILKDIAKNIMFKEFEILENNTEEIEEIKEISDEYFNMLSDETKVKWLKSYIKEDRSKINELVKAVNKLRKDKNNE